ncbi:hypothetical protein Tco_1410279 [Tanacetum coccineum]
MGDENPIRTLGDYSKPSHECYRNTIELHIGNNVVPLRSDTIRLVQNGCSFHGLRSDDPNQHLKDFLKLVDSLDLDGENRERTHLHLFQFSLRDQASNCFERLPAGSITTWEDLTTQSLSAAWTRFKDLLQKVPHHGIDPCWNDPRDIAKLVKAIALPQDVSSTSDRRLIEFENQVQRLMEAHLASTQPTQVKKITTLCEICNGPHDTQYCMESPEQACVDYASSRTDKMGGKRITPNQGPRNFNDATKTWKEKPNFNWAHSQTFTSPQYGSISVHSSSYQMKLERALLDFDSNQEKRLSHLRTQLGQQQDDMIGKINLLWKTIFEKLNDVSTLENAGNSMAPKSIAAIKLNKNSSAPKRVHFVNSIVVLNKDNDTEEEDVSLTNAREHDLECMVRRKEEEKEKCKEEDEMGTAEEVEELFEDEESERETEEEEVEEVFDDETEEEEDDDTKYYNSPPTIKELVYHEWWLENPQPSWVKVKIRAKNPRNIKISCMIRHIFKKHAYIDIESPINIMSRNQYNRIMTYKLGPRKEPSNPNKISNFVGSVRGLRVFIGSFAYKCDFMILKDTTSVIDGCLGEFVFGKPFIEETGLVYNKEEWTIAFSRDNEKITFKMPHTMEIFKQTRLIGLSTNSIPSLAYEENFDHGRTHYHQSLLIGDEYKHDEGERRGIRHLMRLEKEIM